MTDEERLAYLKSLSPEQVERFREMLAPVKDEPKPSRSGGGYQQMLHNTRRLTDERDSL